MAWCESHQWISISRFIKKIISCHIDIEILRLEILLDNLSIYKNLIVVLNYKSLNRKKIIKRES